MALWEDIKTVKRMEVLTWGLQLIQFDFDLRQSFLLRKDMDLIYSVHYFTSVFSTFIISERGVSQLFEKYVHFSHTKYTQKSMHLCSCSYMLCNVKRMSNAMYKGCRERTEYSLVFLRMVNNGILRSHNTDWVLSLISYTTTFKFPPLFIDWSKISSPWTSEGSRGLITVAVYLKGPYKQMVSSQAATWRRQGATGTSCSGRHFTSM